MGELVRMSVSIEKPLFEQLEKLIARSHYGNRSEFGAILSDAASWRSSGTPIRLSSESFRWFTIIMRGD